MRTGPRARPLCCVVALAVSGPCLAGETQAMHAGDFMGPEACAKCHPRHYQEWRGSPHAYSTVDPLFQACNRLALKETGGKIGSFCVNCHAPLAARTGEVRDSLDGVVLSPLARAGVSCEVCHKMRPPREGKPIANASFEMSLDNVLFGPIESPAPAGAHESAASSYIGESAFCGSCHDVLHNSALLEKTFAQWSASPYTDRSQNCQDCHMVRYSGQAAEGGPYREGLRRHNFPAVSIALVPFPNLGYQTEQVQELLRTAVRLSVASPPAAKAGSDLHFKVRVKNSGAGHNIPTGLSNERQMWIEAAVLGKSGEELFSSGRLDEKGELIGRRSKDGAAADPFLQSFSDRFLNEKGEEVGFIWQASSVEEGSIKPLEERTAAYQAAIPRSLAGSSVRIRVRLRFRPFAPFAMRALGLEDLAGKLPIWEMTSFDSGDIPVVEELPRRRRHEVPGDFPDIATAMDQAADGDTILVAPGEYQLSRPLDFAGKALRVRSQAGADRTTLRFSGAVDEPQASVVMFRTGEGPETLLEGFTITGGRGSSVGGRRRGGGIYISGASPTIARCRITEDRALPGEGGGIFCEAGRPILLENVVHSCRASKGGGVAVFPGGGSGGEVVVSASSIQGNISEEGGGGLFLAGGRTRVDRCVIAGNTSMTDGGGLDVRAGARLRIDHSTVTQNRGERRAGALRSDEPGMVRVTNSIFWENRPPTYESPSSSAVFSYSILEGLTGASPSNRSEFPLFRDPAGFWERRPSPQEPGGGPDGGGGFTERWVEGDYHLLPGSPAIDAGDPRYPADPDDSRTDMGAFFLEQPLKAFVRGDAGGDGSVGLADLRQLIEGLFEGGELPCLDAADLNDDGVVGLPDAVQLALYLFAGVGAPAPPFPSCGIDPTFGEGLSCDRKATPCRG